MTSTDGWLNRPRRVLDAIGLLPLAQRAEQLARRLAGYDTGSEPWVVQRFERFERDHRLLFSGAAPAPPGAPRALIVSIGFPQVEFELWLVKALERAGYSASALLLEQANEAIVRAYYQLANVTDVRPWAAFLPAEDTMLAKSVVDRATSVDDILAFEHRGARCGRFAVATAIRRHRLQSVDMGSSEHRAIITRFLAASIAAAEAGRAILEQSRPDLVLFVDRVYSPSGEFLDLCSAAGITAVRWDKGHRNNAVVFKRYTEANRDEHPESLSDDTWRQLAAVDWSEERTAELNQELYTCYATGDWYSQCATQFNKKLLTRDEVRDRLHLDPAKKTAIIFPHILWDSSFFFGDDLFANYEAWLIEVVRAAAANPHLNWILKIHPAHVGKDVADGFHGDPAEVVALKRQFGELPSTITLLHPDTDINTYSLFDVMDYCLTVRGTVGIEAARLGIPTLTAGTGRYDRRGFTIDSTSTSEYLARIPHIQDIPRLTPAQQEAADRFAYGLFILRQSPLTSVTLEYRDASGVNTTAYTLQSPKAWASASDVQAFAEWLLHSRASDFTLPLPSPAALLGR
jgi:hypothetical protein